MNLWLVVENDLNHNRKFGQNFIKMESEFREFIRRWSILIIFSLYSLTSAFQVSWFLVEVNHSENLSGSSLQFCLKYLRRITVFQIQQLYGRLKFIWRHLFHSSFLQCGLLTTPVCEILLLSDLGWMQLDLLSNALEYHNHYGGWYSLDKPYPRVLSALFWNYHQKLRHFGFQLHS